MIQFEQNTEPIPCRSPPHHYKSTIISVLLTNWVYALVRPAPNLKLIISMPKSRKLSDQRISFQSSSVQLICLHTHQRRCSQ
ncbi:hypothetical protein TNCV_2007291 [Trichonephila clavipes]|nr:hypothetical protein TNCV_2007291 [Trichonephila clavipes]